MIYNMYLFDRNGECLYYGEWNRPNTRNQTEEEVTVVRLNILLTYLFITTTTLLVTLLYEVTNLVTSYLVS